MKKIYFFVWICFVANVYSQNAKDLIDGLKKELLSNPDDKKIATIYSDLTWYYSDISIDSALYYGNKAIIESKKLNDSILISQVYSDLGAVYTKKGDFGKAKEFYLKSYAIRKARNDIKGMAKVNSNLGNIYQMQGDLKLAMKTYLETTEYFSSINDVNQVNVIKGNIGALYYELKDYSKALQYTKEVLNYFEAQKMKDRMCRYYLVKGNIYLAKNDTTAAINAFNRSLKMCKEVGDDFTASKATNNLGVVKQNQNKISESKILFEDVNKQRASYNSDGALAKSKLNVAYTLLLDKKYQEAKALLLELNKFFIEKELQEELSNSYKYLVPIYAKLNQPDSVILYQNLYQLSMEKAARLAVSKETAELETKYQTAKKEKLIAEQKEEVKYKNILLLGLAIVAFFIALFGFLIFRQQKLKNKQQEQEFELKSAISQIEKQNELQQQRLSISKDLHDNIGAQLTFIISSVETAKYAANIKNTSLESKLSNISNFTKDTILELRDTIWAMNADTINFEDLRLRILNFIEKATNATNEISFNFLVDKGLRNVRLSSVEGMNVYRCIQEAINNAIKYSEANNIIVETNFDKNEIEIIIKDNGKGFDTETISDGNGLQNMEKRMEEIDGTFQIVSAPEKGTQVTLKFKSS